MSCPNCMTRQQYLFPLRRREGGRGFVAASRCQGSTGGCKEDREDCHLMSLQGVVIPIQKVLCGCVVLWMDVMPMQQPRLGFASSQVYPSQRNIDDLILRLVTAYG
jgi:hypothetical protein